MNLNETVSPCLKKILPSKCNDACTNHAICEVSIPEMGYA